jgi:hypothetical protein
MPCAAKAPSAKKDFWFFSSEKNETKKFEKMCPHDRMKNLELSLLSLMRL